MAFRYYKYRMYPNKEQEQILCRFFGAKRWIFNHYLNENKKKFITKEPHLSKYR